MEPEGYTCPHCRRTSYNAHDKANRYCGGCHHFCDDVEAETYLEERYTKAMLTRRSSHINRSAGEAIGGQIS